MTAVEREQWSELWERESNKEREKRESETGEKPLKREMEGQKNR